MHELIVKGRIEDASAEGNKDAMLIWAASILQMLNDDLVFIFQLSGIEDEG